MSMSFSRAANAYSQVAVQSGVSTASPHMLVQMLFDGLQQALNAAKGAMQRGDIPEKGIQLGKAVRILEEGLKAGVNMDRGGELAANLFSIYDYAIIELTKANLRNDISIIEQVQKIIDPVAAAWKEISNNPEVLSFTGVE